MLPPKGRHRLRACGDPWTYLARSFYVRRKKSCISQNMPQAQWPFGRMLSSVPLCRVNPRGRLMLQKYCHLSLSRSFRDCNSLCHCVLETPILSYRSSWDIGTLVSCFTKRLSISNDASLSELSLHQFWSKVLSTFLFFDIPIAYAL